ncbi:MAG: DNA topoisomerase IB [Polyangiales bacterium]
MTLRAASAAVIAFDAQSRAAARSAGLRYVSDGTPGIRRQRKRGKFSFSDARGQRITRAAELARIRALAIPPAWTDVWICPSEHGHIQATGRDARGRKQYRYHAKWSKARDNAKHARMCDFASRLNHVRAHCQQLLATRGLTRQRVLAALIRVVDLTSIRVGHEEYARDNDSFGLTTLRVRHARVRGAKIALRFRGKSGILRELTIEDQALATIVRQCLALRGPQLFKYRDEQGRLRRVNASHVNTFLRDLIGHEYSIKDFRTWAATVCVAVELGRSQKVSTQRAMRQQLTAAVKIAAGHLGNTPAICRKSYIHPLILDAYADGRVLSVPRLQAVAAATASMSLTAYHIHEERVRRFLLALMRGAASPRALRKAS